MSVYGGFATRQQENTYNGMLKLLVETLAMQTMKGMDPSSKDIDYYII